MYVANYSKFGLPNIKIGLITNLGTMYFIVNYFSQIIIAYFIFVLSGVFHLERINEYNTLRIFNVG